jgi:hypothetical protein
MQTKCVLCYARRATKFLPLSIRCTLELVLRFIGRLFALAAVLATGVNAQCAVLCSSQLRDMANSVHVASPAPDGHACCPKPAPTKSGHGNSDRKSCPYALAGVGPVTNFDVSASHVDPPTAPDLAIQAWASVPLALNQVLWSSVSLHYPLGDTPVVSILRV